MSALAATVNEAINDGKVISVYYNTSTANVGLALKAGDIGGDDESLHWAADINDHIGYLLSPSEIATANLRGVNFVIGVTAPKSEGNAEPTVNNISIVAPVYSKLTTTELANKKVTMCSKGDHAWIYYLSGTAKGSIILREYDLVTNRPNSYLQYQDVTPESSLAAWYDPDQDKRSVVYQEVQQDHLKEFNVSEKQTTDIDATSNAKPLSTFAVTYYKKKAYLYYIDTHNNLYRVTKDSSCVWGKSQRIEGYPKVADDSQLTVSSSNGFNHVFYVSKDDNLKLGPQPDLIHVRDPAD